jgi:hypothetical protein
MSSQMRAMVLVVGVAVVIPLCTLVAISATKHSSDMHTESAQIIATQAQELTELRKVVAQLKAEVTPCK